MSEQLSSAHIASSENTSGTTFDLLARPNLSDDMRCNDLLRRVIESLVVVFPQETQRAIEDSIVRAITDAEGRFSNLNLVKLSTDLGNVLETGSDGGLFINKRPFSSGQVNSTAATTGSYSLTLTGFKDANYQLSVEPSGDPGTAFRWWVASRTVSSASVSFFTTNAVTLNITAQG